MTEGRKLGFWHEIARRVEKEFKPPLTDEEFEDMIRRGRANVEWLRKLADEIERKGPR